MAGGSRAKTGKRAQVRTKRDAGVPLLPVVVGSILGALVILMIGLIVYYGRPQATQTPTVAGIPCDHLEHTQVHYHAALQIVYHGVLTNLRDNTGIQTDSAGAVTCYYWLHVHATQKNAVHIESPGTNTFTLGQFMDVANQWNKANGYDPMRLDAKHVATFTLGEGDKIVTFVDLGDGKGPTVYDGNPRNIVLKSHEVVTIEVTSGDATPPPDFSWSAAPYSGL